MREASKNAGARKKRGTVMSASSRNRRRLQVVERGGPAVFAQELPVAGGAAAAIDAA